MARTLVTPHVTRHMRKLAAYYLLESRRLARLQSETPQGYYAQQFYEGSTACRDIAARIKGCGDLVTLRGYFEHKHDTEPSNTARAWYAEARMDIAQLQFHLAANFPGCPLA